MFWNSGYRLERFLEEVASLGFRPHTFRISRIEIQDVLNGILLACTNILKVGSARLGQTFLSTNDFPDVNTLIY